MIRSKIAEVQTVMGDEEVALYHISSVRLIMTEDDREELAARIIQSFQHGVKDENALTRLLI